MGDHLPPQAGLIQRSTLWLVRRTVLATSVVSGFHTNRVACVGGVILSRRLLCVTSAV